MKKVIFASVMAMGLVACGGGNKEAALSKAFCMDGSSTQAQCDCMAKAAVDELDPKLQNMLLKASKAGDEDAAGEAASPTDCAELELSEPAAREDCASCDECTWDYEIGPCSNSCARCHRCRAARS